MKALGGTLEKASVIPGFGFLEEYAGTNGVGTALEESKVVTVHGEEHYAEFLRNLSCVGVPIHHPITGGVEGVLDLTCLAKDFSHLMPPLLVEVAKQIETSLSQHASAAEVALLERFVRTCRTFRGAVVALRPNLLLSNTAANDHLGPADQAVLWDVANTIVAMGRNDGYADLARGRFRIRLTTVDAGPRSEPGLVIRLAPQRASSVPQRRPPVAAVGARRRRTSSTLAGRSPQWTSVLERVELLANSDHPVAITGEAGTGKVRLAKHLHELSANAGVRLFDSAVDGRDERLPLLARCSDALSSGSTVIVRRIDLLPPVQLAELAESVRLQVMSGRLIVTCTDGPSGNAERALAAFPHQVWLPPLRQRVEDIVDLVPALLAQLSPGRTVTCALPALQALMRCPWPGNIAELRDILATALAAGGRGEIEVANLPASILKRAHRRQFTPFEQSERDLIIETLASVDNNRTAAANILGIGRATLYRKLRSLGISTGFELAR